MTERFALGVSDRHRVPLNLLSNAHTIARTRSRFVALTKAAFCEAIKASRCERGSTAVEFALVSGALISTILFVMTVGLILYYNQALDYATNKASRQIMIGAVQSAATSQSAFQAQVCQYLPAAFNCNNVIVNVQTVTEAAKPSGYYTYANSGQTGLVMPNLSNSGAQYSPGLQGSYEYVQVVYPITFIPGIFSSILGTATYQGAPAYLAVSTAAFRNEQY